MFKNRQFAATRGIAWKMAPRCCASPLIFAALVFSGCAQIEYTGDRIKHVVGFFSGKTPIVAAKKMEDQYFPDERRAGINKLSDYGFGRQKLYTLRYEQIAQTDSDWLVRATAIRALNRSRDSHATPIFIKALSDQNDLVRVEAAKALNNIPDAAAEPALIKIVGNDSENRDARIWAAAALRHYHTLEVARTLTTQLNGREFGVAWQSHQTLVGLCRRDLRYDQNAWLQYLTGPEKPFG